MNIWSLCHVYSALFPHYEDLFPIKFALFSSRRDNILITSLEIKILLTSILSILPLGANCFRGRKYQNRDYKYPILWVYYSLEPAVQLVYYCSLLPFININTLFNCVILLYDSVTKNIYIGVGSNEQCQPYWFKVVVGGWWCLQK